MSMDTKTKTATRGLPRLRRSTTDGAVEPEVGRTPATDRASRLPEPPRVAGRRNPRWIALGVVALCLGGLLSYVIYAQVAAQTAVVAMAKTVNRGAVIETTDLTTTTVSGATKVSTVPAADLSSLVGKRAAYDLVEGSLVPAAAVETQAMPATGRAVVGLKLSQGRAPLGLLTASAPVRLVALPAGDQAAGQTATASPAYFGRVVDVTDGADGTSVLLNVDVAAADAPAIAQLGAQDRIAVLRDADK
jgi:flagella basal body P-ring formation protein FlgA